MKLLEVKNLTKKFGGLTAVNDVTFDVNQNEIVSLIGPNGAGKTTTFSMVTGIQPLTSGQIIFDGEDITNKPLSYIARKGMVTTFQKTKTFPNITVLEAVMIGAHTQTTTSVFDILRNSQHNRKEEKAIRDRACELLDYFNLAHRKNILCNNLSAGEKRVLQVAIAMALNPKLLLLDEPVAGLNPQESMNMMELIFGLRDKGTTILLIEHDMKLVMQISDRIVVINFGNKLAEGLPAEISANEQVITAYLGERDDEDVEG
ncbi:MAG: ABC transporter ATP-binding protein [Dehalobacterium sp.]